MRQQHDFLVIGSGLAGLVFALEAARKGTVAVVTKKGPSDTATEKAQGGVAAVTSPEDSFEAHIRDTEKAGDGLCDHAVVELCVREGPRRIEDLVDYGLEFSSRTNGAGFETYDLGKEGGHSKRRVLHCGDLTGREIERVLLDQVHAEPNITVFENHVAVDLITRRRSLRQGGADRCLGAYVLDAGSRQVRTFLSGVTVLATGGAGKVYLVTSNPDVATGDGIAMAYRAGADVANMEFFQFHPSCLFHPEAKSFLISEAVRGEGGVLLTLDGRRLMEGVHPDLDLAPRDVVARAIDRELKTSGAEHVLLDISHRSRKFLRRRFPNIYDTCKGLGIDVASQPIPVVPAAHYCCGGVMVDHDGCSTIPRLYAIGETSCTGLHGANRLASNSLLEALVYAHRAAAHAIRRNVKAPSLRSRAIPDWDTGWAVDSDESVMVNHNWDEIRRCMWHYVSIVRTGRRLARARRRIEMIRYEIREYYWDFLITPDLIELRNLALVAQLMVESAMSRQESRGLHYNLDYPDRDDRRWLRPTVLRGWQGRPGAFER